MTLVALQRHPSHDQSAGYPRTGGYEEWRRPPGDGERAGADAGPAGQAPAAAGEAWTLPGGVPAHATIADVRALYPDLIRNTYTGDRVGVTAPVMLSRTAKLCFATIPTALRHPGRDSLDRVGPERRWPPGSSTWISETTSGWRARVLILRRGDLVRPRRPLRDHRPGLRPLPEASRAHDVRARCGTVMVTLIVNPEARRDGPGSWPR